MTAAPAGPEGERSTRWWVGQGMRGVLSTPALILTTAIVGFAGLARDAGLGWAEATFMTFAIWALPAQIILIGAITAGGSLAVAAFAVALSSLRLMPMVVALAPELKGPGTRRITLYVLSHFVAITAWVFAMERLGSVPREKRTAFFAGFAVTLTTANTLVVAVVFNLIGQLPALATGALAFLTPAYFLSSLYGSARDAAGRLALVFGMLALPLAHAVAPRFELVVAGLLGGVPAFLLGRWLDGRRAA